ncbi:alpha/beta hydrolase [Myxococcota bacterium]|nr:alpha/beta hydrolase [Myxococcota bacterium]MBU1899859.1 alpha/beta hydrolase [Myxococcota bacterium]
MQKNNQLIEAADGTPIAWSAHGQGPPLVFINGFTTSNFFWRYFSERFRHRATLIHWDYKGHGDSGPARSETGCSMTAMVDDLRRVMDAAGVERAPLIGFSMGCQVMFEAWRHIPERISAFVPILGTAGRVFDDLMPPFIGPLIGWSVRNQRPETFRKILSASAKLLQIPITHDLGRALGMIGTASRADMRRFRQHFARMDAVTVQRIGQAAAAHSALDVLPTISRPTLVVVGGRDTFTPAHVGRSLAADIPGAELLYLPRASHTGLFEHPGEIGVRVERFFLDHRLLG